MTPFRHTLPPEQRLKSRRLIDELFAQGAGGFIYPVRYLFYEYEPSSNPTHSSSSTGEVLVLFTATKRNHKRANVRNLLKRRLREAFRLNKEAIMEKQIARNKPLSVALLYSSKEVEDYQVIENAVKKILQRLVERD